MYIRIGINLIYIKFYQSQFMEQDQENVSRNYLNLSDFQKNFLLCMLSIGGYKYQFDIFVFLKY